jgi:ubiquinone/menaquinone biosynthesis C-methylase UbiE
MLARVLEPEVMDTPEEARDYDSMDHSAVNRVFASDFLSVWDTEIPILDVGTGTAQIPIELCRQCRDRGPLLWDSMHIVAIDLADHMLALARANVEKAGLTELVDFGRVGLAPRIKVEKADAKRFPYPDGHFGAVISNSIIHHIPDPFDCFAEMHRVCGGFLFIRDLLRPADAETLAHLVKTYAGDANDHQRKMFAESLHAALTLDEVREMVGRLGYQPDDVHQTSDRHWTWATPKKWAGFTTVAPWWSKGL